VSQLAWDIDGWIILVGVLSACSCTLLGNYLVLRGVSLMGDAIAHAVLPGIAIGFLIANSRDPWMMICGAAIVGVITALLTQTIIRFGNVERGAAMGVVFSVFFAVGLILIRRAADLDKVHIDPDCVLYGNIVLSFLDTVDWLGPELPRAAIVLGGVFVLNALFVLLFYKELKISSFDPSLATTVGVSATVMHYVLMTMVAITTVANFEAVGSILVVAMLIVPAATAYLLTDRLAVMIGLSLVLAAAAAVVGHLVAFLGPGWLGLSTSANTGPMMAVVTGVFLLVALLVSPRYGVVARMGHQWLLAIAIVREDILGLLYRWREAQVEPARPVNRQHVLAAVGGGVISRWALWSLRRRREVELVPAEGGVPGLQLAPAGLRRAAGLVRSHRLWEVYLAEHFALPLDHLHEAAGRVEHFITPAMGEALVADLPDPPRDPHGKEIPESPDF
jgi:manganese/zinc/iron transport system permease protein